MGWRDSTSELEVAFEVDGMGLDPGSDWSVVGAIVTADQCLVVPNSSPTTIAADFCECDNRGLFGRCDG